MSDKCIDLTKIILKMKGNREMEDYNRRANSKYNHHKKETLYIALRIYE